MNKHHACWKMALSLGITLIIIITIIIITAQTTMGESYSNKSNKISNFQMKFDDSVQKIVNENPGQMTGVEWKVQNIAEILTIKPSLPVEKLAIESESIQEIDIQQLCDKQFDFLNTLHLSYVSIVGESIRSCKFNETLESFAIHRCSNHDLAKVIHRFPLYWLKTLDLSHNALRDGLNRFWFVNLTNVREILLTNCMIEYLPYDTFYFVRMTIISIDLRANYLTRLMPGFVSIIPKLRLNHLNIELNDNPWQCNCSANANVSDQIKCLENCDTSIVIGRRKNVVDIDADDMIEMQCNDLTDNEKTEMLLLKKQTHEILIDNTMESMLLVAVRGPSNAYLIWYNDTFTLDTDIHQNIVEYVKCIDVRPLVRLIATKNTTFTFCVLTSLDNDAISPFNCLSYYVPSDNYTAHRVWIDENDKTIVIVIMVIIVVCLVIFGVIFGLFLLRKFPRLLRFILRKHLNRIDNRNSCNKSCRSSTCSVYSVEKDVKNHPIHDVTYDGRSVENFDYINPLEASCLNDKLTSIAEYWDIPPKLPTPPPNASLNDESRIIAAEIDGENDNCDGNQTKLGEPIDLKENNDVEALYTKCKVNDKSKTN